MEFIKGFLGVFSPTEEEFNQKYAEIDIDGDGVISQEEMSQFIKITSQKSINVQETSDPRDHIIS
jgi:Ca2+-binding EF-hand superfamily protein